THDPEEALALSDSVGVMASGRLLQVGAPRDLYERPVSPYVAGLLGDANVLRIEAVSEGVLTLAGGVRLTAPAIAAQARPRDALLIRPGHLGLSPGGEWRGRGVDVTHLGGQARVGGAGGGAPMLTALPPRRT